MRFYKQLLTVGCLWATACQDYHEGEVVPLSFVQIFDDKPLSAEADGESQTLIQLTMLGRIPKDKAIVELVTTKGTFLESGEATVQLNVTKEKNNSKLERVGLAHLISPTQAGDGRITARFADYSTHKDIKFTQAYPDDMRITSSSTLLKRKFEDNVTVTVQLIRDPGKGKPTLNSPVTLTMTNDQGKPVGFINPDTAFSNAEGLATFTVTLGDTLYTGGLKLVASTPAKPTSLTKNLALKTIP